MAALSNYPMAKVRSHTLELCDPGLGGYFLNMRVERCWVLCRGESDPDATLPFTVNVQGKRQVVWLEKIGLMKEFGVSQRLIEWASRTDQLMQIVFLKIVPKRPPTPLHFSRKDYSLEESIYITPQFTAYGTPGRLYQKNGITTKLAKTPEGKPLIRKIYSLDENEEEIKKRIAQIIRLALKPHILPLLAEFQYQNLSGKEKWVLFHPQIEKNLFERLFEGLPEEDLFHYAKQLFEALLSLEGGAHGDLTPQNVRIEEKKLFLSNLDYYRGAKETEAHKADRSTWSAPEVFSHDPIVASKLDVWPLGMILYYLLAQNPQNFPWEKASPAKGGRKSHGSFIQREIKQPEINKILDESSLTSPLKELIKRMIVVNVEERCTLEEAAHQFFEMVAR
jgi:serine/threonine protein kinase